MSLRAGHSGASGKKLRGLQTDSCRRGGSIEDECNIWIFISDLFSAVVSETSDPRLTAGKYGSAFYETA